MREWELTLGDCRKELPKLEGGSIDAVVTDPPYGLVEPRSGGDGCGQAFAPRSDESRRKRRGGFMGKAWDAEVPGPEVWAECLRVAKAGAYLLAFGGTRTHHRLMCAVEDAGWELTDTLCWLHGQGFPKGKGCLKPAWEPIVLARKPAPRVAPLGIDECRIAGPLLPSDGRAASGIGKVGAGGVYNEGWDADAYGGPEEPHPDSARHDARGRYPANLVLSHHPSCVCRGTKRVRSNGRPNCKGKLYSDDRQVFRSRPPQPYASVGDADGTEEVEDWLCHPECPVFLLDSQAGERAGDRPGRKPRLKRGEKFGWSGNAAQDVTTAGFEDSGNVSRFFYVSKADKADRGEGNDHPTTKSTALMAWLCKLVARPGETVLDPFMGSASTGVACLRSGRRFIGIERDPHYFEIARQRLAGVDGPLFAAAPAPEKEC